MHGSTRPGARLDRFTKEVAILLNNALPTEYLPIFVLEKYIKYLLMLLFHIHECYYM